MFKIETEKGTYIVDARGLGDKFESSGLGFWLSRFVNGCSGSRLLELLDVSMVVEDSSVLMYFLIVSKS